jgi:dTDP-4-amino-4,6-dideoxygalactose transaminase
MKIPFNRPSITKREIAEVVATLESGWITTGPRTRKFEEEFASYCGAKHAVAVNSCTAAMHLGLSAMNLQPGDEVITSPYTFAASAEVILYHGARPVFVDITPETFNIDPEQIEKSITEKTRVLLPVHIAGLPSAMDKIIELAEKYELKVLEDAAHATETMYHNRKVGSISNATAFSFYATKNLATGEGGMLTTNDDRIAERARILSLHGMSRDAWKRYHSGGSWQYEIVAQGYKYNMTDIQAALGLVQLSRLEEMSRKRKSIVERFNKAFGELPQLMVPPDSSLHRHAWHLYLLRIKPELMTIGRDRFIELLQESGISPSVHFIPLHLMPLYQKEWGYQAGDFPQAEAVFKSEITLPLYPDLAEDEVEFIIDRVIDIVSQNRK